MKKRIRKIIEARARCGTVGPPVATKDIRHVETDKLGQKKTTTRTHRFARNPETILRQQYESAPAKEKADLVTKWLREIQAFNMITGLR